MDILKLSGAAKNYYAGLVTCPSGWEKYVLTDGKECCFVKSDYQPAENEAVFYCMMRRKEVSCQLYKRGDGLERYFLIRKPHLCWQAIDTWAQVSVTFAEGLYRYAKGAEISDRPPRDTVKRLSGIVREMGEWTARNRPGIASCDLEARCGLLRKMDGKGYWASMAGALDGTAVDWADGQYPGMLYFSLSDYLASANEAGLDAEAKKKLLGIAGGLSDAEAKEAVRIVQSYWDAPYPPEEWAKDLEMWLWSAKTAGGNAS